MRRLTLFITVSMLAFFLAACDAGSGAYSETIGSPYASAVIGDTIQLGGLDWLVLDIQDGKALVLSEKILSQRAWNGEQALLTWGPSDIRQYLNGAFFENTFTEEEKTFIVETNVINNENPWFGSAGTGSDTLDRVFLLSLEEVVYYFGDSGILDEMAALRAAGHPASALLDPISDAYNDARAAAPIGDNIVPWWWLRTPGRAYNPLLDSSAAAVNGVGEIIPYGIYLVTEGGVRPALWLRI